MINATKKKKKCGFIKIEIVKTIKMYMLSALFAGLFFITDSFQDTFVNRYIDIGTQKQLFLDDYLIDYKKEVKFVMNPPHPTGEELIKPDLDYEKGGQVYLYSSVLKDNDKTIKVWYDFLRQKSDDPYDHDRHIAYAESKDGIVFEKPIVGRYVVDNSTDNNIVIPGIIGGSSVWIDPLASPIHRYKTQAKTYPSGKLMMHSSPDGISWNTYSEIDPKGPFDTQTIVFWDESRNEYVFYGRHFIERDFKSVRIKRRAVRWGVLHDFDTFDTKGIAIEPDSIDLKTHENKTRQNPVDYYGAVVFPYSECKDVYIMMAQTFWHWVDDENAKDTERPGTRDIRLAFSRNGENFMRLGDRKAFLSPGNFGHFDSKQIWVLPNPIVMGDEIWIYYCGVNWDRAGNLDPLAPKAKKRSAIGRAVMRLDGFVSLDTDYEALGEIITKPIKFSGDKLEINVDTRGGGSVRVEILDEHGTQIPGFELENCHWIVGNSVRFPVEWNHATTQLSGLNGQPVRLRFVMRDAKLYAFKFH